MTSKLKSFSIYGLFGTSDVHIPFDEDVKILIGENGIGKTQVLSMFYYTLIGDFRMLLQFSFDKLELVFLNEKPITITKCGIESAFSVHPIIVELLNKLGTQKFLELKEFFKPRERPQFGGFSAPISNIKNNPNFRKLFEEMSFREISSAFRSFFNDREIENDIFLSELQTSETKITEQLGVSEIIYFPTFRRVEEDLHNLGYEEEDLELTKETSLIQFGMDDVKITFNKIEEDIKNLLKNGLSDFTKDILKIIINNTSTTNEAIFDKISEEDLEIIFARAGNGLEQELKDAVTEAVKTKQFKNPFAGFLLQKLIEIYEKQKTLDNSIKAFRDICNGYLINKKVFYDESAIKIYLKSDATKEEIELSKLSSGEKQIISIFSKIYLSETEKRFIVLFDEPELSLSVFWQKKLLPDIMKSKKCNFLLAVTHSPFIFDNELDEYAIGLNEYVQLANQVPVIL